ncbi:putative lipoyltransferase 2, mitochondrial [Mortierella sp. AD031]|nr:putative lipoyltransferase 2, mitochondrial [Mortierella sp. AD031]
MNTTTTVQRTLWSCRQHLRPSHQVNKHSRPIDLAVWTFSSRPTSSLRRAFGTTSLTSYSNTTRKTTSIEATATATGTTCPTTIARPQLSPLPFIYLRNLPYERSSALQQLLVDRQIRLRKEREDLRATAAAITVSADGSSAQGISDQEAARLQDLGAVYVESLRGGEITFHGPGQLVAYPILDLKPIKLSVRCYVSYLEKSIIATCAQLGVKAITTENTGVWINDQKKIAAIGVHVQRYITSHGLALNCNTNLEFFKQIIACGLTGKETTSLSKELNDPSLDVQAVIPFFLKGFGSTFNREFVPLSETRPELERAIQDYIQTGDAGKLR